MISKEWAIWFVHLSFQPPLPLNIQRSGGLSAVVTGGTTGSHRTGHGETYWDKLVEVIKLGFLPVDVAKELGLLPKDWTAPDPATLDENIRNGVYLRKK